MDKIFKQVKIKKIDVPGKLIMSPVELKDYIDFTVKRVYFFSHVTAPTGAHCHKIEEELFILLSGECTAIIDHGSGLEELRMRGPTDAICVPNLVWHGFKDFTPDAIMLAITSTNYNADRSDYVEDYAEFLKLTHR
ncbi:MAG: FdtA/QdtA family cupin domain-containing protein [bacterium]|nr:FdtA/QdtA family cupin domain-containing protein [bacterium]